MAKRMCNIPSDELDGQLIILLLNTYNKKNTKGRQAGDVSCLLLSFQTCNSTQDQTLVNKRGTTPQQVNSIVVSLVLSKDGFYHFLISFKDYWI